MTTPTTLVTCVLLAMAVNRVSGQRWDAKECERRGDAGGRQCSKDCWNDQDCMGQRRCMCDGQCGKSCINPDLRCGRPRDVPRGRVQLPGNNDRFGMIASYTCDHGYILEGMRARVCQGDGTWMGREPRCVLNHSALEQNQNCGPPPPVHNAKTDDSGKSSYSVGTNIRYSCLPGFTMHKDSIDRAWCVSGQTWVGPNITCSSYGCSLPRDIEHGRVEMTSQNTPGGQVKYSCNKGYFIVGNDSRTCLQTGSWDGAEPICEQSVCGPPPTIDHATHDANKETYRYVSGSTLMYSCQFGYYPEGSDRAICSGQEGRWEGPTLECKARDCGDPGEIRNGWRTKGYHFTYPSRVNYNCFDGYEVKGRPWRECQASGEWKGTMPVCEPIRCDHLQPPLNGVMIGTETTYSEVTRFQCNPPYVLVGSEARTCQSDGSWSGQDAHCEEKSCGWPGILYNGRTDGHRTTVGSLFFFVCDPMTTFRGRSNATTCMENGEWSTPLPECLGRCQIPSIQNGSVTNGPRGAWEDHDTVITVICHDGLVLNDTLPVRCDNGSWTIIPRCVPAPCNAPPPHIENGHRVFLSLAHGARARYYCLAGWKLEVGSPRYLTCEYSKWHGGKPKCQENLCPNPGSLVDGKVYKVGFTGKYHFKSYITDIKHGDRLVYECTRGYRLVGPSGAACVNGNWSPKQRPSCLRSRHPVFTKIWSPFEAAGSRGNLYY